MKVSKQALLGTGVLLGGSVLLYATVHQVVNTNQGSTTSDTALVANEANVTNADGSTLLTVDLETEKNLLAQKQREREARVKQQEHAVQQYLTEQQRIEAAALAKSRAENQLYTNPHVRYTSSTPMATTITPVVIPSTDTSTTTNTTNTAITVANPTKPAPTPIATPQVTPRPSTPAPTPPVSVAKPTEIAKPAEKPAQKKEPPKAVEKPAATAQVTKQPTPVPAKQPPSAPVKPTVTATATKAAQPQPPKPVAKPAMAATNSNRHEVTAGEGLISLSRRYNIPVESLASANNLTKNATLKTGQKLVIPSADQVKRQQQYQAAQQKLTEARQTVKATDAKGSFGVQVALATDQKKADEIAKKLRSAGYKVKTSQTSRGVRVVVGPETGKAAALALKDKVNTDPRIEAGNAWVLYW